MRDHERLGGYAAIPHWLLRESDLSQNALMVLIALTARENASGECWPSHARLAADARVSVASVQRALRELREAGHVSWVARRGESGGQTSNHYRVHVRPGDNGGAVGHGDRGGRSQRPGGSVTVTGGVGHGDRRSNNKELTPENTLAPPDGDRAPVENPDMFEAFMDAYPRPIARAAARRAWDAINADPALVVTAAAAFGRTQKHIDPRYIPYPSTWLRERRWEDQDTPTRSRADRPGPEPPHGLDGRAYTAWLRAVRAEMGRGASDEEAAAAGAAAVSAGHDKEGAGA